MRFEFNANDPALKAARELAHKRGIDQETFSEMLGVYASTKMGEAIQQAQRTEYFAMTTNLLVAFYSTYGHVHQMALAVAERAQQSAMPVVGFLHAGSAGGYAIEAEGFRLVGCSAMAPIFPMPIA